MSPPLSECGRTSLFRPRASLLRVTSISQSNPANVPASDCRSGAFLRCCSTAKERASNHFEWLRDFGRDRSDLRPAAERWLRT
jgi:hypothetical protein